MRPRTFDRVALTTVTVITALYGWIGITLAAPARADEGDARAYASEFGPAVCETLDAYPSFEGIFGIGQAIVEDGLTAYDAGQVIAMSVAWICPRHIKLVRAFANTYGQSAA